MHRITEWMPEDEREAPHKTVVWVSDKAQRVMDKRATVALLAKLEEASEKGFANFSGEWPLRSEWDGVWAFGIRTLNVRLVGFYEDDTKKDTFIIIDGYKKKGQKLTNQERAVVNDVAAVKKEKDYARVP